MRPLGKLAFWVCVVTAAAAMSGCGGGSGSTSGSGGISGRLVPTGRSAGRTAETFAFSVDGQAFQVTPAMDGSFTIHDVPAGLHTLTVHSPNHAVAVVAEVIAGTTTDVGDLVPRDAGQISGLVTDADTHAPISGALVTITEVVLTNTADVAPHPIRVAKTNSAGSYTIDGLPVGGYVLNVSKSGYNSASLQVSVNAGSTTPGDLALAPSAAAGVGTMKGTVYLVTDSGSQTPLAGALVRLSRQGDPEPMAPAAMSVMSGAAATRPSQSPAAPPELYTFTDETGAYVLDKVPAADYTAVAVRPGLVPDSSPVTIAASATLEHTFLLRLREPQVGIVTGTVTDSTSSKPIAGAQVTLMFLPGPEPLAGGTGASGGSGTAGSGTVSAPDAAVFVSPGAYRFHAVTGTDGTFKLIAPAGDRTLAVYAEGYTPQNADVQVKAGTTVNVSVSLTPSPATGFTISGHVYQSDGKTPAAGATVYFGGPIWPDPRIMAPMMLRTATTDANGAYSANLSAGKYDVSAFSGTYSSGVEFVSLTQNTTLDLVLSVSTAPPPAPGH